jgi:hypothetical protein
LRDADVVRRLDARGSEPVAMRVRAASLALAAALASTACGGGGGGGDGGGGGGGSVPFAGPYHLAHFRGTSKTTDVPASLWGLLESDGVETLSTGTTTQNEDGVVSQPVGALSGTFAIEPDGTTSWFDPGMEEVARGGLTAAQDAVVVGSVRPGDPVSSITILLRQAGVFSNASLAGAYRLCTFGAGDGAHAAGVARVTFDGVAFASFTAVLSNADGVVTNPTDAGTGPYSVSSAGRVSLAGRADAGILAGGEVLVGAGVASADSPPVLAVGIKESSSASAATFSGTYSAVFFEYELVGGAYRAFTATATADGAGGFTLEGTLHAEGTVLAISPASFAYSVAPDGALTFPGGLGQVSSDGRFAAVAGSTSSGLNPALAFFVRR